MRKKRRQRNKTWTKLEKLCTASNKAFLCISSRIVTFFLIEQSYVAKTSCKMGVQNTWGFHGDISIYPCGQNNKNILLSSSRSGYLFSIGSMKDNPSNAEEQSRTKKSESGHPLISWLAWWPCCGGESQDGCRWASSSQLVSKSIQGWRHLINTCKP